MTDEEYRMYQNICFLVYNMRTRCWERFGWDGVSFQKFLEARIKELLPSKPNTEELDEDSLNLLDELISL